MISVAVDQVYELIYSTWTEITQTQRDTQMTRINFLDLVRAHAEGGQETVAAIQTPFVVISEDPTEDAEEWGLDNDAKWAPLRIYYVAKSDGSTDYADFFGTTYKDTAAYVRTRLEVLREAFKDDGALPYEVVGTPNIDISQHSDANTLFSEDGLPFFAGCLTVKLLVCQPYYS